MASVNSILPSIDAVDRESIDWSDGNYRSTSTVPFYYRSMPSIEDRSIGVVTPLNFYIYLVLSRFVNAYSIVCEAVERVEVEHE
jgi:hypothetical protein